MSTALTEPVGLDGSVTDEPLIITVSTGRPNTSIYCVVCFTSRNGFVIIALGSVCGELASQTRT